MMVSTHLKFELVMDLILLERQNPTISLSILISLFIYIAHFEVYNVAIFGLVYFVLCDKDKTRSNQQHWQ